MDMLRPSIPSSRVRLVAAALIGLSIFAAPFAAQAASWKRISISVSPLQADGSVKGGITAKTSSPGYYRPTTVAYSLDGVALATLTNKSSTAWALAIDTTKVADGAHTLKAVADGSVSASMTITVKNATVATASASTVSSTTATTAAPTTTTVAPTTTTAAPATTTTTVAAATPTVDTWGNHMGVSMMAPDVAKIDKTAALGVKWLRMSIESGWGFDTSLITYAHAKGLKILQVCQKGGHTYDGSAADVSAFATYCAGWVDKGVDAIEIGNEWNHVPFYYYGTTGAPENSMASAAKYTAATINAIRAKSATFPVLNNGFSSPGGAEIQPKDAVANLLNQDATANGGALTSKGSAIGHHGYAYNCDSPLRCSYPTQMWNTFLQSQDVYAAAKTRGYDRPIWITETGGPSGGGNNLWGGTPFTLDTQRQLYVDYIQGAKNMRANGTPIQMLFWHTIQDGQSATNAVEQTFGLYDLNGALKPAGQVVQAQAAQAW